MSASLSVRPFVITLAVLGLYGTWVRSLLNGTLAILFTALHRTGALPGTNATIRTRYTGIYWPLDYLLEVLVLFFWQAVDGSHPPTTLFALYFAGQHIAVIATMYIDSSRSRKGFDWRSNATLWLVIFQLTGIAASGPWYVLLNLNKPPASSLPQAKTSRVLVASILSGYVALVVWMGLPSSGPRALVSYDSQQIAVVCWNIFPFFMQAIQLAVERALSTTSRDAKHANAALSALRHTYIFALLFCVASHYGLLATSLSAALFPTLFDRAVASSLHPTRILQIPLSHQTVPSLGSGALQFMQWDALIGFASMLTLALVGYGKVTGPSLGNRSWPVATLTVLGASAVVGPGGALVLLKWIEDELSYSRSTGKEANSKAES